MKKHNAKNTEIKVAVAEDLDTLFEQNETLSDGQAVVIVGGYRGGVGWWDDCSTTNNCACTVAKK